MYFCVVCAAVSIFVCFQAKKMLKIEYRHRISSRHYQKMRCCCCCCCSKCCTSMCEIYISLFFRSFSWFCCMENSADASTQHNIKISFRQTNKNKINTNGICKEISKEWRLVLPVCYSFFGFFILGINRNVVGHMFCFFHSIIIQCQRICDRWHCFHFNDTFLSV